MVSEPRGSRFVDAAGIEKPSVHLITYELFDSAAGIRTRRRSRSRSFVISEPET